jgi:flagellar biosynthesis chaperone FliJ
MAKINRTVVRNDGFMRGSFETRYRHNERQNESYYNGDIDQSREHLNVRFRQNLKPDGTPETYGETFDRLMAEGRISDKWLKPDSKLIDEMVFDVNTDYFEQRGGYEYAKDFFAAAYQLAVKEVGSEDYILSAVLHSDERNKALSEQLGRDVYHYHLHVAYVPVVEKREYFRKKKGEPDDAPKKLKAVYQQISHAKKWPMRVPVERDGKTITLNSYSLLQDRFFEGMRAAGFDGFERGEVGSTKEHLDVLDYKIQQEKKRLEKAEKQAEKKEAQIEKLDAKIAVKQTKIATLAEIDAIGKPAILGGVHLTDDEAKRLKSLARQAVKSDERMAKVKRDMAAVEKQFDEVQRQLMDAKAEVNHWHREYTGLWNEVKPFIDAIRKFPQKMLEFVKTLFPQVRAKERTREIAQPLRKKSYEVGGR